MHADCVPHQVIDGREYIRAFGQGAAACEHAIALIEGSTRAQVLITPLITPLIASDCL